MKTFLFLFVVLAAASCSSWEEGWTDEYRQQFTQACLEGDGRGHADAEAFCRCRLEKTMATYPTIAALLENKDSVTYRQALESCR